MRWQDCGDEQEKYQLYLCSREWAEKREAVRKRAFGKCERCHLAPMDAVHHLTYARKYAELPEDLQATCRPCHDFTHGKSDADPVIVNYERFCDQAGVAALPVEILRNLDGTPLQDVVGFLQAHTEIAEDSGLESLVDHWGSLLTAFYDQFEDAWFAEQIVQDVYPRTEGTN